MNKNTLGWESNEKKKHPNYENCMGINFSGFPHSMDFGAFPQAMRSRLGNT